jgi:hypothetical protein
MDKNNYQRLIQDRLHASRPQQTRQNSHPQSVRTAVPKLYVYILANQLARYSGAVVDVMSYSLSAVASSEFIEPQPHYSKQIQYTQLYEELKALILI